MFRQACSRKTVLPRNKCRCNLMELHMATPDGKKVQLASRTVTQHQLIAVLSSFMLLLQVLCLKRHGRLVILGRLCHTRTWMSCLQEISSSSCCLLEEAATAAARWCSWTCIGCWSTDCLPPGQNVLLHQPLLPQRQGRSAASS